MRIDQRKVRELLEVYASLIPPDENSSTALAAPTSSVTSPPTSVLPAVRLPRFWRRQRSPRRSKARCSAWSPGWTLALRSGST